MPRKTGQPASGPKLCVQPPLVVRQSKPVSCERPHLKPRSCASMGGVIPQPKFPLCHTEKAPPQLRAEVTEKSLTFKTREQQQHQGRQDSSPYPAGTRAARGHLCLVPMYHSTATPQRNSTHRKTFFFTLGIDGKKRSINKNKQQKIENKTRKKI